MKRYLGLTPALLFLLTVTQPSHAGWVRVPRDSPVVIHGRVQQPGSFDPAKVAPQSETRPSKRSAPCTIQPFPDPGSRPIWVPGSWCWNGSEAVWVPGHWVW